MGTKVGNVKKGTGKKAIYYIMDEKKVCIDFSGNDDFTGEQQIRCYRNDASVLFSLANSYWAATLAIEEQIKIGFELEDIKKVSKLIIPYLFNFRHFVELSIKALFMGTRGEKLENTHDICKLFARMKDVVLKLERDDRKGIFAISDEEYDDAKTNIEEYLKQMEDILIPYFKKEPAVEYYRFLFDRDNNLDFPEIDFDFNSQSLLQKDYHKTYKKIIREIHRIHYIYDMS